MTQNAEEIGAVAALWKGSPGLNKLNALIAAAGGELRLVGGAVRDALLGLTPHEIDCASTLPPEKVIQLLEKEGIKVVPTGLAHGTVTAVIDHKGFEITTLRRDLRTDGRHAEVAFTDDWQADAQRRDFTFNALSLDAQGQLHDDTGGQADLAAGRLRFIGDPEARIREDVLRLLRFFRFLAQLEHDGDPFTPDPAGVEACRSLASLLPTLSAERVWKELSRLLVGPFAKQALDLMEENGILRVILPEGADLARFDRLSKVEKGAEPVRRLAALLPSGHEAVARRLRLSNEQADRLTRLARLPAALAQTASGAALRQHLYDEGATAVRDALWLAMADGATPSPAFFEEIDAWQKPVFPIQGRDLLALGAAAGPGVGRALKTVEAWWRAEDFKPDRSACLARARQALA